MNWSKFFLQLLNIADKYYVIAGIAFLLFYVLLKKRITWKKIQLKFPEEKDYRREILFSTLSILIFSLPPLLLLQTDSLFNHIMKCLTDCIKPLHKPTPLSFKLFL